LFIAYQRKCPQHLVRKFYECTKRPYNEGQMKNKWDFFEKKVYPVEVFEHERLGMGKDPITGWQILLGGRNKMKRVYIATDLF
jgi:hypothetical protein